MRVAFLNPADAADPFFGTMVAFMRAAAGRLGIELEVVDGNRSAKTLREQAHALLTRPVVPEYLLLVNEEGLAVDVLPIADRRGIRTLVLNEGLMVPDVQVLGKPGEKYANWLGELIPDDRAAGHLLATALLDAARSRGGRNGKIEVVGLGGSFTSSSLLRINGLRQAIAENADAVLHEVVPANWESERASSETARLLDRHPGLTVVWSASDGMAQAAAETIRAAGKVPGKDVLVGGIDWAPFAFDEVRRGTFAASVGGHFLDGAWALVLLHDHHRRPSGTIRAKTQLALMTRDTVDIYERVFAGRRDVDFSRFSRVENPALQAYPAFSVETVL